ncbi:hypothetical protein F383_29015 [Gossypium arboreum]|nr:hypothetical protein F383_29015 [Gossypium arboreum]
MNLRIFC